MAADYDVFLSHAWADDEHPQQLADALTKAGIRVWLDTAEINDFASITHAVVNGLANSKVLVAYYSRTYPLRRACQWELTAAFLAAQTEGDPRRRVLVVNPERGTDHILPIELRDAKFLGAPNTAAELQQLAEAILDHVNHVNGSLADVHPLSAPDWYGMTPVGSTHFVGRLKEMWEIHSLLHESDVALITGTTAGVSGIAQIRGLGGVGKSLLAEEYALHFGAAYPGGIFWLRAYGHNETKAELGPEQREALLYDQMRGFAKALGVQVGALAPDDLKYALANKIKALGQPCLWVVDDLPDGVDGESLRRWFAPHRQARTLFTTRSREYDALAKEIDLSVLSPDEAQRLLTLRRKPASKNEEEEALLLAKDLGYHALALDVVASALRSHGGEEPYRNFRVELLSQDDDALELSTEMSDALPNGHEKSIARTMLGSIRKLPAEGLDLLRLASVLAVAPIPGALVTAVFEKGDGLDRGKAEQRQWQAFYQATKASLAEIEGEQQDARSVHTLVSRAVRFHEKRLPKRTRALRVAAVEALGSEIGEAAEDPRKHYRIESYVPHARQLVKVPTSVLEANLVSSLAQYDDVRGAYTSAKALLLSELEFRRRQQGPDNPDVLSSWSRLARTLWATGELKAAREIGETTLQRKRRVLGLENPETLSSMSDLASTLYMIGDLQGALRLHQETLTLRRRLLGPRDAETLLSMGKLANVLWALGDFAGSRKLDQEALAGQVETLGPDHPDTLLTMNNLALTLKDQCDLVRARKLQEEVLARQRQLLGAEHPHTLVTMNNLALTLKEQGDLLGARNLEEEALAARLRVLRLDHPYTLKAMSNLAETLRLQGEFDAACKLQQETLSGRRWTLGPHHQDTLKSMSSLAEILMDQQKFPEALELCKDALPVQRDLLGSRHSDTTNTAWNLFRILRSVGDREGAQGVLRAELVWLVDTDPATLGAQQRAIRERVAAIAKDYPPEN